MKLSDLEGQWKVSSTTLPQLVKKKDHVIFSLTSDTEAVVRIRRDGVTVLLSLGFVHDDELVCPLPFCTARFRRNGKQMHFRISRFEGGPTPEGGGTSVGPPTRP